MKSKFGTPKTIWDGNKAPAKRWLDAVTPPVQGLFGYDWQGRFADFGAGGHVDIGTGSYFNAGAMKVFFWACV